MCAGAVALLHRRHAADEDPADAFGRLLGLPAPRTLAAITRMDLQALGINVPSSGDSMIAAGDNPASTLGERFSRLVAEFSKTAALSLNRRNIMAAPAVRCLALETTSVSCAAPRPHVACGCGVVPASRVRPPT